MPKLKPEAPAASAEKQEKQRPKPSRLTRQTRRQSTKVKQPSLLSRRAAKKKGGWAGLREKVKRGAFSDVKKNFLQQISQSAWAMEARGKKTTNFADLIPLMLKRSEAIRNKIQGGTFSRALRKKLKDLFDATDKDGSKSLDMHELRRLLEEAGMKVDDVYQMEEIVRSADKDGDGEIDFQEFLNLAAEKMCGGAEGQGQGTAAGGGPAGGGRNLKRQASALPVGPKTLPAIMDLPIAQQMKILATEKMFEARESEEWFRCWVHTMPSRGKRRGRRSLSGRRTLSEAMTTDSLNAGQPQRQRRTTTTMAGKSRRPTTADGSSGLLLLSATPEPFVLRFNAGWAVEQFKRSLLEKQAQTPHCPQVQDSVEDLRLMFRGRLLEAGQVMGTYLGKRQNGAVKQRSGVYWAKPYVGSVWIVPKETKPLREGPPLIRRSVSVAKTSFSRRYAEVLAVKKAVEALRHKKILKQPLSKVAEAMREKARVRQAAAGMFSVKGPVSSIRGAPQKSPTAFVEKKSRSRGRQRSKKI